MENLKEYLRKNNDGEYILEVTNEREAQEPHAKHWIEVPKGCDYLISVFGVNSFIDSDVFAKVKPKNVLWSRKPMKEYLRKNSNGTYSYVGTVRPEHVSDFMIEIPEGATKLVSHNYVHLPIMFVKPCANGYSYCYPGDIWSDTILDDIKGRDIFWSRQTHPEELPFIDDEPKSLNDQYAEIEKVRQTLNQRQSQYGSFEDVAMITEQMVDVMRKGYYENLAYNQKMALYMICSKMARIVNGDPNHKDSWHDIAGYATLIDEVL